ncbi:MAG: NAD(P)/FAD-dependent oxidoreductase [Bacteroidales bacterium]
MLKTDICIVGAGPAGSIAALFLAKAGVDCILADQASFPRDKICGDGISGWVLSVLGELDQDVLKRLAKQPFLLHAYGIRIVAPNHRQIDLPFLSQDGSDPGLPPGFTGRRLDFDNFLINEIKQKSEITLLEATRITNYHNANSHTALTTAAGETIEAKLVIFASGASSDFTKVPGGIIRTKKNTMTGIKTYYRGVTGFHEKNYVELHFLKSILPGYFWIFPLPDGLCNAGIGLDQNRIAKKKINLKKVMLDAIETIPYLSKRFEKAEQVTRFEAYGLPLWDRRQNISGDRFMLAGDAASLVDPVTGEGIGHAAISGMLAAKQAIRCIQSGDFSNAFMQQYDESIYDKIGKELSISSKILQFIKYPWLFNLMVNRASKSKTLREKLTLAMTDLEVRKRLKEPSLYIKVMLGR